MVVSEFPLWQHSDFNGKAERSQRKCSVTKPVPGTLQEGGAPFETTHWTVVLQASKPDSDEAARKALATFSEAYWPPLYTFVRRRGYSPADAQDLIQGFFVHLFEQNTLSRADQEKGRLRTQIKIAQRFVRKLSANFSYL